MKIQELKEFMAVAHSYIHIGDISDEVIQAFLDQPHIKNENMTTIVDCFSDYVQAQGLCEVTP